MHYQADLINGVQLPLLLHNLGRLAPRAWLALYQLVLERTNHVGEFDPVQTQWRLASDKEELWFRPSSAVRMLAPLIS